MYFSGKIVFEILNTGNIESDIIEQLGFEPTKVIVKGNTVGYSNRVAPYNIWAYEKKFEDSNFSEVLISFYNNLLLNINNIVYVSRQYERTEINIYINTNYAQFGFSLPNNIINVMSKLGLEVNFHFLSSGEVE